MLPTIPPMELIQQPTAFDHPDWLFEVKHDGFRAVAYIEDGSCRMVSRKDYQYTRFQDVANDLGKLPHESILDGELVVLDDEGKTLFYDLMFGRGQVFFYAFDIMYLDGEDLTDLPLIERKQRLTGLSVDAPECMLYVDHIEEQGKDLYEMICQRDMEGIVAKPKISPYSRDKR